MSSVKVLVRKLGIEEQVRNSFIFKYYVNSSGNPFYFFHGLCWGIVKLFTLRKNVEVNGIKLSLPIRNRILHARWYLIKRKEPEVREWIDQYVKDGDTLFDVGGNMALVSMYAAKRYPNLKILCFEPEYSNLALIKDNLRFNSLKNRIDVYSLALSDQDGLSQLHIQDENEGTAAHTESRENIAKTDEGYSVVWREGIVTYTLDSLCKNIDGVPSALKIDTDGNELKILKGAEETLKNTQLRTIIIEMPLKDDSKSLECKDILKRHGFSMVEKTRETSQNEIWCRS